MSTQDAIRRAQGWLAKTQSWAFGMGDDDVDAADNLAALGPASVGLAVALACVVNSVDAMEPSVFMRLWKGSLAEKQARDALAEWAQAAGERES